MIEGLKTLLLVDDTSELRFAFRKAFEGAGYTVLEAENGKQGLTLAQEHHPDIILSDVMMPVMDGLSMVRELRKDPWGSSAFVIMLTSIDSISKVSEAMNLHVTRYVSKSEYQIDQLVHEVETMYLDEKRSFVSKQK